MSEINVNSRSYSKTENGTSIIQSGQEADKDLFMKLLVAQMTNQDPFNPQDPTQYITQLAQFSTLEQMMSVNDKIEYLAGVNNGILVNSAVSTASSLIGKNIELYSKNDEGNYIEYEGEVKSTFIKDGLVYLEVELKETGELKEFRYEELVKVN